MSSVARPGWKAETDEQRRALADAVSQARRAKQADEAMWQAVVAARELGVPDSVICKASGVSRATLNRKFGKRP